MHNLSTHSLPHSIVFTCSYAGLFQVSGSRSLQLQLVPKSRTTAHAPSRIPSPPRPEPPVREMMPGETSNPTVLGSRSLQLQLVPESSLQLGSLPPPSRIVHCTPLTLIRIPSVSPSRPPLPTPGIMSDAHYPHPAQCPRLRRSLGNTSSPCPKEAGAKDSMTNRR